jgi:hypothetical protein
MIKYCISLLTTSYGAFLAYQDNPNWYWFLIVGFMMFLTAIGDESDGAKK